MDNQVREFLFGRRTFGSNPPLLYSNAQGLAHSRCSVNICYFEPCRVEFLGRSGEGWMGPGPFRQLPDFKKVRVSEIGIGEQA